MSFNLDATKQDQEIIFFSDVNLVVETHVKKHLGMFLDTKLTFLDHFKTVFEKTIKTKGLLRKLRLVLSRSPLFIIYKLFVRHHLDYRDIIYEKPYNATFHQKMGTVQYNPALAITSPIRGSSKEKLYQELGLERFGDS